MIIAKTPEAKTSLMKEFSLKRVLKTYQALVDGIPEHKTFKIIQPIARNPKKPTIFKISHKGKPAETLIEVLSSDSTKNQSLLQLQPKTGRTHQLRVHLSANGWPIVGDRFYNPNFQDGQKLQLKAVQLTIQLPSKEWKTFKLEDLESK
jgi:23S rRNA pseudouridine1911/1915/1917 synthase